MSEELDRLKALGVQKLYEDTHIPLLHIHSLLSQDYEGFSKVQFVGFISILEREYNMDLNGMKAKGLEYFADENEKDLPAGIVIAPKRKQKRTYLYVLALIAILALVFVFFNENSPEQEHKIDDSMIQNVQNNIESQKIEIADMNESALLDENISDVNVTIEEVAPEVEKTFKIVAKSKVWLGYIDVNTNKKYQKTFEGEFNLDPEKEWLLMFGHGYIDMSVNGEAIKFSSRNNVRFLYEDGKLETITSSDFKRLNRGNSW